MSTQHANGSRSASHTPIGLKVDSLLSQDDTGRGPCSRLGTHPHAALSEFEGNLRDWGMVYGMVFALARGEDPWESTESVAARALETAWPIYLEWSGQITEPEKNLADCIDDLQRAYEGALPTLRNESANQWRGEIAMRLGSAIEMVIQEVGHQRES